MLAVIWAIFMRSLIHYFFTVRSCGCWFFRIYFGILQILYAQSLLSYEILGILESDFYHWILGILDLDVSFHCGIQEILDPGDPGSWCFISLRDPGDLGSWTFGVSLDPGDPVSWIFVSARDPGDPGSWLGSFCVRSWRSWILARWFSREILQILDLG